MKRNHYTFGVEHFEMIHSELKDLGLLQLGGALLLEGGRDETPQLREAVIDPVPPPLLDDPAPPLPRHVPASRSAALDAVMRRFVQQSLAR